ncbi:extensin family protein [Mesorhizobium sp. LHD-90]|uniref:extensin-like domain-containing protein n=1 Tax=Mesorhizobium sp. LHD-90 TaxID=3071414 RepID=UPI0027DF01B4|nr:extensin family protein [Mesorhizobium sp. LHD-90]MDQ6436503.1 extensin family protein [Mesorhizobium sp. LHD-90]
MDFRACLRFLTVLGLSAACLAGASAQTPKLPEKVPAPKVHAPPAGNIPPEHLGDTPVPEARPGDEASGAEKAKKPAEDKKPAGEPVTPATAPLPTEPPPAAKPKMQADPRSEEKPLSPMPAAELACRWRLRDLGVAFEDRPAEADEAGCSMPYPVSVRGLGKDVALEPAALMNCATAEAAARFARDIIAPAAKREFGTGLKSVTHASAYVCRPRNGTTKLSEHAFGNALDISRFSLADGKTVDVILRPEETEARFLGAVRKAACGPFKTVLGPGNADHDTHFHLDLAPRRNGGTVCE